MKNRIKELRERAGYTLKELGEKLEIRDNTLSQYENDKRSAPLVVFYEIARFFGVSLDYLLYETNKRSYPVSTDDEIIDVLKGLHEKKITIDTLTNDNSLSIYVWITLNVNKIKMDYPELLNEAAYFIHEYDWLSEMLAKHHKIRMHENNAFKKIEELLFDDYCSVDSAEVLEFIEQANRIGIKKTKQIIDVMKKEPDLEEE